MTPRRVILFLYNKSLSLKDKKKEAKLNKINTNTSTKRKDLTPINQSRASGNAEQQMIHKSCIEICLEIVPSGAWAFAAYLRNGRNGEVHMRSDAGLVCKR